MSVFSEPGNGDYGDKTMTQKLNLSLPKRGFLAGMLIIATLLAMFVLASCRDHESAAIAPKKTIDDSGIHKTYERGPATLAIDLDHAKITIADRLTLTLSMTIDEDYQFELPGFGEKLEQFGIVDYHTSQPVLTGGNRKKISRTYILEPFLSGEYKIPPMAVLFWKMGEKTDPHKIETEELMVRVTSLLPEKMAGMKIHDIVPPLPLPRSYKMWMTAGVGGGVLILIILGAMILYKKKKAKNSVQKKQIPAHELAYMELSKLMEQELIEKGEIKLFYHQISDILRRYIEKRFGLCAPEQTTEEFLSSLKGSKGFITHYNSLLKSFLSGCDLVKFAEHQPSSEDIQLMFDSCKAFIFQTEEQQEKKE